MLAPAEPLEVSTEVGQPRLRGRQRLSESPTPPPLGDELDEVGDPPLLGIALSLTLVLTGFACAYIAMSIPRDNASRGTVVLIGAALAFFEPWIGLLIGVVATLVMVGWDRNPDPIPHD